MEVCAPDEAPAPLPARPPVRRARPGPVVGVVAAATTLAAVAWLAALVLGGGSPEPAPAGLPDPGALTSWGVRLVRLAVDAAAVLAVGSLVTAWLLLPDRPSCAGASRHAVAGARTAAAVWAGAGALLALLTAAELVGGPVWTLTGDDVRQVLGTGTVAPRLLAAALAAGVAVAASRTATRRRLPWLTLAALAALVAPAVTGHAASGPDHEVATAGLVVHVLAAAVWVGGLAGLLLHVRRSPEALAIAVPRFSALALGAFAATAGSGVLAATARLGLSVAAWTSAYGGLVLVKAGVLVVLGGLGHLHRRRTLTRVAAGEPAPFRRLAAVELVLMAGAAGLAAALARTPTPAVAGVTEHGPEHPSLPSYVAPLSSSELLTAWRPNAVVLLVVAVAAAAYLTGARRLAEQGHPWDRRRTAAFLTGLALLVVLVCSGVATYAPALVSVHLVQFLAVLLVVPALLALGSPLTLWRALHGGAVPRLVEAVTDPLAGAALVCALVLATFRTPLVELSLSRPWVHLLLLGLAVLAGTAFLTPLLGGHPSRGSRPTDAGLAVIGVAACLALLAYQLRYGDLLLAGWWFLDLNWQWADPVADQRLGGLVAAGAALFTLLLWPASRLAARVR
jgi:cytochrome c oxidase assembly factor CtaG/putative copper export protein